MSDLDRWLDEDDEADDTGVGAADATPDAVAEAPDAPADPSAPISDETPAAARTDRGDGRDAQGKFVEKAQNEGSAVGTVVPTDAVANGAVTAGPTPSVPPTPVPHTQGTQDGQDGVQGAAEAASPYVVKFRNTEFEIPGSRVTPEGVVIPQASVDLVSKYLGRGIKWEAEGQQFRQERALLQVEQAKVQAAQGEIDKLFQIASIADETEMAEAALAYVLELRSALPTLQREAALAEREARWQVQSALSQPDPDEQAGMLAQAAQAEIDGTVAELKAHPSFAGMTDRDWGEVGAWAKENEATLFYRAGRQLNAEEQAAGVTPGQLCFNAAKVIAVAQRLHGVRKDALAAEQRARSAIEDAKKVAEQNVKKVASASAEVPALAETRTKAPTRATPEEEDDMSFEALSREFASALR